MKKIKICSINNISLIVNIIAITLFFSLYAIELDDDFGCCYKRVPAGAVLANGRNASVNGRYFYRMQAGEFSETRRMVLLK